MKGALERVLGKGKFTVLAVVVALVLVAAAPALAKKKAPAVLKGDADQAITAVTGLKGNLTGAILKLDNDGGGTALELEVQPGNDPMTVNSDGKVENLNADKLDGQDSGAFLGANGKAADADKLDGQDSTAFGVSTAVSVNYTDDCDNPAILNECAPITVTVPAGGQYVVDVRSSLSAKDADGPGNQEVSFGPIVKAAGTTQHSLISVLQYVTVQPNIYGGGAASGRIVLDPSTYTISTGVDVENDIPITNNGKVFTEVMVRDAAGPVPAGAPSAG